MTRSVLVFIFNQGKVCLGRKKTGHGLGKWNGFGGRTEQNENSNQTAARELFEESGINISPDKLTKVAELIYHEEEEWVVDVFTTATTESPKVTTEMEPKWFSLDTIPWEEMWPNDKLWLSKVLKGEKFTAAFWHDKNGNLIKHEFSDFQS